MVSEENHVADSEQIASFVGRIQCSCHVVVVNQDTDCSLQSSEPPREEPCRAVPWLNLVSASDCLTISYDVVFDTLTGNDTTRTSIAQSMIHSVITEHSC